MPCRVFALLTFWTLLAIAGLSPHTQAAVPAAPTNCHAVTYNRTASTASIDVIWNDNSINETSWTLYYSVNGGAEIHYGPFDLNTTLSTGETGIGFTGLSLNTTYRFRVVASNASGSSASSNTTFVSTFDLNKPTNFTVTAVDPFNVSMHWEENSTSEDGFALEGKIGNGAWQYVRTVAANSVSINPINLIAPLTNYSFRIRAYKGTIPSTPDSPSGTDVSPYSDVVTLDSPAYTLTATAVAGQPTINLSWPNIFNESGYQIMVMMPGTYQYQQLDLVSANVTSYQIGAPTIEPGKTYSFLVRPYVGVSIIGTSNDATAITDGITSKPGTSSSPGAPFSHTFTQISSASINSRSLTGIPSGLTFNSNTGVLSGTYPAVGNYTLNYNVTLTNGATLTQTFYIRVRPAAAPPTIGNTIPSWTTTAGSTRDTPITGTFTDLEADSAVRMTTTMGTIDFILFNTATPATVTNFMNYVNAGKYNDVAFHRSIYNFVIQAGGYQSTGISNHFTKVAASTPVTNEPGIANTRGTISMAKLSGDPNSATSEFFISEGDNTANLDYQNGGFTVFGRVAGNGMTVADSINNLPTATYGLSIDNSSTTSSFADFPMNAATAPAIMDQSKVVKIQSITSIPTLSYSITSNSNPTVASATIVAGQLHLSALAGGQTTISITATDLDGLTATQTIPVTVSDTFTTWSSRTTFPNNQNGLNQNPDGDALNNLQEYAFFGDPAISNQSQVPTRGIIGTSPAPRFMTLTFPVRKFTTGLTYQVDANDQLTGTWTPIWNSTNGFTHPQVTSTIDQTDRTLLTIKDTAAIGSRSKRFLRVKVTQQ